MIPPQPTGNPLPRPATAEDDDARSRDDAAALAQQDGRAEARAGDRVDAAREQAGPPPDSTPETPIGAETLVTWDTSPDQAGHRSTEIVSDDEADVSADLAEEGSGEAEQELRRAANAEDHPRHRPPAG